MSADTDPTQVLPGRSIVLFRQFADDELIDEDPPTAPRVGFVTIEEVGYERIRIEMNSPEGDPGLTAWLELEWLLDAQRQILKR